MSFVSWNLNQSLGTPTIPWNAVPVRPSCGYQIHTENEIDGIGAVIDEFERLHGRLYADAQSVLDFAIYRVDFVLFYRGV